MSLSIVECNMEIETRAFIFLGLSKLGKCQRKVNFDSFEGGYKC